MKSVESQIANLQEEIAKVRGQIAAVQAKEDQYKARRQNLEQRLRTREKKLFDLVEAYCLADQRRRFAAEPAERKRFLAGIGAFLTDSQRAHFMPPSENGGAEPGGKATAEAPASDEPAPESRGEINATPVSDATSMQPRSPDAAKHPAGAAVQSPDNLSCAPGTDSQASLNGEDEQTPATRKPSTSATKRPRQQARPASEKQRTYVRDLIHKHPAVAEEHNVLEANLGSMTQAEASRAIKVLRPVAPAEADAKT